MRFTKILCFAILLIVMTNGLSAQIYLASNGLTKSGSGTSTTVALGGTLANAQTLIDFGSSNANSSWLMRKGATNYFFIANAGNIGIGNITPAQKLDVTGTIRSTGFILTTGAGSGKVLTSDATGIATWVQPSSSWLLSGNGGTTPGTNFVGTTDNQNLVFKRNNVQSGLIDDAKRNTSFGVGSLNPAATGTDNTGFGHNTLLTVTSGLDNTAIGTSAIRSLTTGNFNTAIGQIALTSLVTGDDNTAVGQASMYLGTSGFGNTAIGSNSLQYIGGNENVAMGKGSLGNVSSGSYNTALGRSSGRDITGNNNIFIGYYAGYNYGTVSNRLYIDNNGADGIAPLIYGEFDNQKLQINGTLMAPVVVIGNTPSQPAGYSLYVELGILTEKVKVALKTSGNWADYVFEPGYRLKPLHEVESFIKNNGHLPDFPSASELVKEGIDLAAMDARLLAKIEELTLYIIELKKEMDLLKKQQR